MRIREFLCSFGVAVVLVSVFPVVSNADAAANKFEIRRGVNISHWLSQSGRRGEGRREWFTEKDVKLIASVGFDHIRLPVDEEQLWDEAGNKEKEAFELLHNAINWAQQSKLRIIVDRTISTPRKNPYGPTQRPRTNSCNYGGISRAS